MTTPQSEIDRINTIIEGPEGDLFRDLYAFSVARLIVEHHDAALLDRVPRWVWAEVQEMCRIVQEHGSYLIVSSAGEVDHTEMMRSLAQILDARG